METVTEILRRQAAAITAGKEKLTAAAHLEAAAKLLRAEAKQPVIMDFKKVAREKKERALNFFAAFAKDIKDKAAQALEKAGFKKTFSNSRGLAKYSHPQKPGLAIHTEGDQYTALLNGKKVQSAHVKHLPDYLKSLNSTK